MSQLIQIVKELNGTLPNEDITRHKFVHYAAHAETLAQFFDGLGIHKTGRSFPSSALILEFYQRAEDGGLYVSLNYYDGEKQTFSILKMPGQAADSLNVNDFAALVDARIQKAGGYSVDLKARCQNVNNFDFKESDYYSGQTVIDELIEAYDLNKTNGKDDHTVLIIIIVSVLIVALFALGFYCWRRYKRTHRGIRDYDYNLQSNKE